MEIRRRLCYFFQLVLAGNFLDALEVQVPPHCGFKEILTKISVNSARVYDFESRHNLSCSFAKGLEHSFAILQGQFILGGGTTILGEGVVFLTFINVSVEFTNVHSETVKIALSSKPLEGTSFFSPETSENGERICTPETDTAWERKLRIAIFKKIVTTFVREEDHLTTWTKHDVFSQLQDAYISEFRGNKSQSMRLQALTPLMAGSGNNFFLNVKEFNSLAAFADNVTEIIAKNGDFWVENTEAATRNDGWLDRINVTRKLTGLSFPGKFKLNEYFEDKLQCSEEMKTTVTFLREIDTSDENSLKEDIRNEISKTSNEVTLVAYFQNLANLLCQQKWEERAYQELMEKSTELGALSSNSLQLIYDSLVDFPSCNISEIRQTFKTMVASNPTEDGLVFLLDNVVHKFLLDESFIQLVRVTRALSPSSGKFNIPLRKKTVERLTTFLVRLGNVRLPLFSSSSKHFPFCFSFNLPINLAEHNWVAGLDSLLPLISVESEEFYRTYNNLRESCDTVDTNVCYWPVNEFKRRLQAVENDVLLVNFIRGMDCLDIHRKVKLLEYFKDVRDGDVRKFLQSFLSNRVKRGETHESFEYTLDLSKLLPFLNQNSRNEGRSSLGTSIMRTIPYSTFQFDMIYGTVEGLKLPKFVKLEIDRVQVGMELHLLPYSQNEGLQFEISFYINRVPVWRQRIVYNKGEMAVLQFIIERVLLPKAQETIFDGFEDFLRFLRNIQNQLQKKKLLKKWRLTEFDNAIQTFGLPLNSKSELRALLNLHIDIPNFDELYESRFDVVIKSFLKIEKKHQIGYAFSGNLICGLEKISEFEFSTSFNITFSQEDGNCFVRLNTEASEELAQLKIKLQAERRFENIKDQMDPQKNVFTSQSLEKNEDARSLLNGSSNLQVLTYETEMWANTFGFRYALTTPEILASYKITPGNGISISVRTNTTKELLKLSSDYKFEECFVHMNASAEQEVDWRRSGLKWGPKSIWFGAISYYNTGGEAIDRAGFEFITKGSTTKNTTVAAVYVPKSLKIQGKGGAEFFRYEVNKIKGGRNFTFASHFHPEILDAEVNYTVQEDDLTIHHLKGYLSSTLTGSKYGIQFDTKFQEMSKLLNKSAGAAKGEISLRANDANIFRYKGELDFQPRIGKEEEGLSYVLSYSGESSVEELGFKGNWTLPFSLQLNGTRTFWSEGENPGVFLIELEDTNFKVIAKLKQKAWECTLDWYRPQLGNSEKLKVVYDFENSPLLLSGSRVKFNESGAAILQQEFAFHFEKRDIFFPILGMEELKQFALVDVELYFSGNQTTADGVDKIEISRFPLKPIDVGLSDKKSTFTIHYSTKNETQVCLRILEGFKYQDPTETSGTVLDYVEHNVTFLMEILEKVKFDLGWGQKVMGFLKGRTVDLSYAASKIHNWEIINNATHFSLFQNRMVRTENYGHFEKGRIYKLLISTNNDSDYKNDSRNVFLLQSKRVRSLEGVYKGQGLPEMEDMYSYGNSPHESLSININTVNFCDSLSFPDIQWQLELLKNEKGHHGLELDIFMKTCLLERNQGQLFAVETLDSSIPEHGTENLNRTNNAAQFLEAEQYVMKHHFINKRNFGASFSRTQHFSEEKSELYSELLLKEVDVAGMSTGQDITLISSDHFILQCRLKPRSSMVGRQDGETKLRFELLKPDVKTNLSFSFYTSRDDTEDDSRGFDKDSFEFLLKSKLLDLLGYEDNMLVDYAGNFEYWKEIQSRNIQSQSTLRFLLPNGDSGNMTFVLKKENSDNHTFITSNSQVIGGRKGSALRRVTYQSVAALLHDGNPKQNILIQYDTNAEVSHEDFSPILKYNIALTLAKDSGRRELVRVIGQLETWDGNTSKKSSFDTSLMNYFDRNAALHERREKVSVNIQCGTRKVQCLTAYVEDGVTVTNEILHGFWLARLKCGEQVSRKEMNVTTVSPDTCTKREVPLASKGEYSYRDGNEFDHETFWIEGGKCFSEENVELPVCSKLFSLSIASCLYHERKPEAPTLIWVFRPEKFELQFPLRQILKIDQVVTPLSILWGLVF